jgi:hypothetical protein
MTLQRISVVSVMAAALVYGETASPGFGRSIASDPDIDTPENPLNPGVQYAYQGEKSPGTAMAWSGLGTLAPIVPGVVPSVPVRRCHLALYPDGRRLDPWSIPWRILCDVPNRGWLGIGLRMAGELPMARCGRAPSPISGFSIDPGTRSPATAGAIGSLS